jgi:hypothetical protein
MSTPSDGMPRGEAPGRPPWESDPTPQSGQPGAPSQPYGQPGAPNQPYGQPAYGQQPGHPAYGQQPGQPAYGQQPGQPPYGQPAYGQPQFNQPPYPPPPYPSTAYGQPQAKSRRPLFLILGGVVALIVVLVVVFAAIGGAGNPRDTADAFMAALKSKDVGKAHSLLCKDGQDKESESALRDDFDLDDRTITGYSLGTGSKHEREGKDETLIPVTIDYDQGGQVKLELGVWSEGGQKVCSLNDPAGGS